MSRYIINKNAIELLHLFSMKETELHESSRRNLKENLPISMKYVLGELEISFSHTSYHQVPLYIYVDMYAVINQTVRFIPVADKPELSH